MKNILLVDDERSLLLSMAEGLEAFVKDFKVHTAMNGREALEVFDSHPVDVVVTDLRMPEMEGFELLDWMRERHPEVPAIVLSAFVTPRIEDKLREMGAAEVLAKPLDFRKLAASILAALAGRDGAGTGEATLADRLRALEAEKGTVLMEVESAGQSGFILVVNGEVQDAVLGKAQGEEAALSILRWQNPVVRAKEAPAKKVRQNIYADVSTLLRRAGAVAPSGRSPDSASEDLLSDSDLAFLESIDEEAPPRAVVLPEPEPAPRKPETPRPKPPPPRPAPAKAAPKAPPQAESSLGAETSFALTETLSAMAEELEHVKLLALSGADGTLLACQGPWTRDRPGAESGFFEVLSHAQEAVGQSRTGNLEEVVVQASSAWVLVRMAGAARLAVVVGRESTLGNVRLVAARYARVLAGKMTA